MVNSLQFQQGFFEDKHISTHAGRMEEIFGIMRTYTKIFYRKRKEDEGVIKGGGKTAKKINQRKRDNILCKTDK